MLHVLESVTGIRLARKFWVIPSSLVGLQFMHGRDLIVYNGVPLSIQVWSLSPIRGRQHWAETHYSQNVRRRTRFIVGHLAV